MQNVLKYFCVQQSTKFVFVKVFVLKKNIHLMKNPFYSVLTAISHVSNELHTQAQNIYGIENWDLNLYLRVLGNNLLSTKLKYQFDQFRSVIISLAEHTIEKTAIDMTCLHELQMLFYRGCNVYYVFLQTHELLCKRQYYKR